MSNPDLHLFTGAYVLDALDDEERASYEAHLLDCADCQSEVVELRATTARLAVLSSEPAPPEMRARVLAQAAATRQAPPESVEPAAAPVELAHERRATVWSRWAMPVAAALLGVLALSLGAWGVNQRDRADSLAATSGLVASVLTAKDATSTSAQVGTGRASVVVSPSTGQAVLIGTGLATPADGKVYEMWRIDESGAAASAGTYVPASDGSVAVPIAGSLEGKSALAVSIEPKGGSLQPTTTPLAAFTLPA